MTRATMDGKWAASLQWNSQWDFQWDFQWDSRGVLPRSFKEWNEALIIFPLDLSPMDDPFGVIVQSDSV